MAKGSRVCDCRATGTRGAAATTASARRTMTAVHTRGASQGVTTAGMSASSQHSGSGADGALPCEP